MDVDSQADGILSERASPLPPLFAFGHVARHGSTNYSLNSLHISESQSSIKGPPMILQLSPLFSTVYLKISPNVNPLVN